MPSPAMARHFTAQPDAQSTQPPESICRRRFQTGTKRLRSANRLAIIAKAPRLVFQNRRGIHRESHLEMVCALSGW
jgi:hypothetical protein